MLEQHGDDVVVLETREPAEEKVEDPTEEDVRLGEDEIEHVKSEEIYAPDDHEHGTEQ